MSCPGDFGLHLLVAKTACWAGRPPLPMKVRQGVGRGREHLPAQKLKRKIDLVGVGLTKQTKAAFSERLQAVALPHAGPRTAPIPMAP